MIIPRRAQERGHANLGWLDSWHSFSFSQYYDPKHMGFRTLRVINDDRIASGMGFGTHGHQDMEIITYVLSGALQHKDSMGTGSILKPGDVQRMSAGAGVTHSEFNASKTEPVHLLQIWIEPDTQGVEPRYDEQHFDRDARTDVLRVIASPDGRDGSLSIHQDVEVYASLLSAGHEVRHALAPGRAAWIQIASGEVTIDGAPYSAGDAVAVTDAASVTIAAQAESELLLFDLR